MSNKKVWKEVLTGEQIAILDNEGRVILAVQKFLAKDVKALVKQTNAIFDADEKIKQGALDL